MKDVVNKDACPIAPKRPFVLRLCSIANTFFALCSLSIFPINTHSAWASLGDYHWYEIHYKYQNDPLAHINQLCQQALDHKKIGGSAIKHYPLRCREEKASSTSSLKKVSLEVDYSICASGAHRSLTTGNCQVPNAPYTTPPGNTGNNFNNTCNPINIATGNKFFAVNETSNVSTLTFKRYYNSVNRHWSFDYTQRLVISKFDSEVIAKRADGNEP